METPLLCRYSVTDPYIESFAVGGRYLQTSPEYAMKRLLAQGSGAIFQISKAFRQEEVGRRHTPEFSLLEWYRPGFNHHQLMDEIEQWLAVVYSSRPAMRISYQQCFETYLGIDPFSISIDVLKQKTRKNGIQLSHLARTLPRHSWLELLMSHVIEPKLGQDQPCFVFDYPEDQAALAKIRLDTPPVAERFELYIQGIEIANGFHELTDAKEQSLRFMAQQKTRQRLGLTPMAVDSCFIQALKTGLPDCSGVAVGLDRLLMLIMDTQNINDVFAIPWNQA